MPVYAYTTLDDAERRAAGTLLADTPVEGRQRLRDRGLRIVSFAPETVSRRRSRFTFVAGSRRREQVADVARQLSLLLRAGVPLAECLEILTRCPQGRLTSVLKDVRDRLTGGGSLADALAAHEAWFDDLFVAAVRVGELTGNLDESLLDLAEHLRVQQTLRSQVTAALAYPAILLCLGVGVVIFLMTFVIPQLLSVLEASDRPLPASTMLLKGASDILVHHWLIIALVAVGVGLGWTALLRSENGRTWWHRTQLRLPLLGPLMRKRVVAAFAQQMALLLKTGIPFVEAARCVAALTGNRVLATELTKMASAVEAGSDIAPTMNNSRLFPPVVVHLVAVGQNSGELTEMLSELKVRYETEVQIALTRFTAALEPLLIILLASAVGFVVFACLMPILETTRGIAS